MKRYLATALAVIAAVCPVHAADSSDGPALKDVFKGDFLIGAAINAKQFGASDKTNCEVELIRKHFNSTTPENVLKFESVHPRADHYNFGPADRYVEFGRKNHMFIIGHNLIWHNQTPRWVFEDDKGNPVDRDTLLQRMREHIFTVVGRYKGRIKGWDVVNEAVDDDGSLRKSRWLKIIGEDYLVKAYQFAHEADPDAQLYYNEYSIENTAKGVGAVALIKKLQAAGIPIAAIGIQGHYNLDWPSREAVGQTIDRFAQLGIKVMITELDVDVLPAASHSVSADVSQTIEARAGLNPYPNGLPDSVQQALTRRYADLFAEFFRHRAQITRVTFWGVTDADSWLNSWPVRDRTDYPLLFDRQCRPKPAFDAVIAVARGGSGASQPLPAQQ